MEEVGSSEECRVAACLQQSTIWKRVLWRLIAVVGPTAEDCVAAGLGVVYSSEESQTAAPLNKSDSSVCRYLGDLPSMLSGFASVLLDVLNRKGFLLAQRKRVIFSRISIINTLQNDQSKM